MQAAVGKDQSGDAQDDEKTENLIEIPVLMVVEYFEKIVPSRKCE